MQVKQVKSGVDGSEASRMQGERRSGVCKIDDKGIEREEKACRQGPEDVTLPRTRSRHPQVQRVSSSELETTVRRQCPAPRTHS